MSATSHANGRRIAEAKEIFAKLADHAADRVMAAISEELVSHGLDGDLCGSPLRPIIAAFVAARLSVAINQNETTETGVRDAL